MAFRPGKAFANKDAWLKDIQFLDSKGVPVHQFMKKAVENGKVSFFDSYYYQPRQREIRFNRKQYSDIQQLVREYKSKSEENLNYNGTREFKDEYERLMDSYRQF